VADRLHRQRSIRPCETRPARVAGTDRRAPDEQDERYAEMSDHPLDMIPAFVLGALDIDAAIAVGRHLAACPSCRAEAEAFRAAVAAPPVAGGAHDPPPRVKRQLLARVAAASGARRPSRWTSTAAVASLALALLLGAMFAAARGQVASLNAQLAQRQGEIGRLQNQLAEGQQLARFIGAPRTERRALDSPDRVASAAMYMQPESARAVLIVHGLPPAAPGTTYQFWLAGSGGQVPSSIFDVAPDGTAVLAIDAPAPVGQYGQVMVTVERAGGSRQPSELVVLSGELTRPAALRYHTGAREPLPSAE
jgi:hypothetical protein